MTSGSLGCILLSRMKFKLDIEITMAHRINTRPNPLAQARVADSIPPLNRRYRKKPVLAVARMSASIAAIIVSTTATYGQTVVPPTNGPCIVSGTTATCTGNLATGVDADGPAIDTLNINTLTQNLGNTSATASVDFDTTNGNANVVLDLGAFQAVNSANATNVIDVSVLGVGNVGIDSTGTVAHIGLGGGIVGSVDGNGNVSITSRGNVTAQGIGINGFVTNNGNVAINSFGNVVVSNTQTGFAGLISTPTGISANATNTGDVNVNSTGNIIVSGGGVASGIRVNDLVGFGVSNVTLRSVGNINVSGGQFNNLGISAGTVTGNLVIVSEGDIVADTGIASFNSVPGAGDSVVVSIGNITARDTGIDIDTPSGRADVTVIGGTVSGADGVSIDVNSATASTLTVAPGATVQSTGALATNRAIEVTGGAANASVAGTVTGGGGGAIQFAPGAFNDRLSLSPSFAITGTVFADAGTDTLRFEGLGNGAFDLSQIDTGANTQQFRQFETFEVANGTWAFSNATTAAFTGTGGTITGNATFGGMTMNAGSTLAPGAGQGTMTVNGNLAFNAGSSFLADLQPDGTSDLVNVTGTTTISNSGTSFNAVMNPATVPAGQTTWTLINATGGVTGQFGSVTDNLPDVDLQAVYTPNAVQLTFVPAIQSPALPLPAASLSEKEIYPSANMAALESSLLFAETLRNRGLADPDQMPEEVEAWSAVSKSYGRISGLGNRDWRVWGGPIGSFSQVDGQADAASWDTTRAGVAIGVEREALEVFGASAKAGIGFGYLSTNVDSQSSDAQIDSFHVGAYAAGQLDRLRLSGAAAYAYNDYAFDRFVTSGINTQSDAGGHTVSASVESFFNAAPSGWDGVEVGPVASVGVIHGSRNALTERGAGVLNLSVDEDRATQVVTAAGLAASVAENIGGVDMVFDTRLTWEHVAGDRSTTTASSIPTANATFTTESAAVDRNRIGMGLGVAFEITEKLSGGLRYDGTLGKRSRSHDFSFGLTYRF